MTPTHEQVEEYIREKGLPTTPGFVFRILGSKDWKTRTGKPYKRWQTAVTNAAGYTIELIWELFAYQTDGAVQPCGASVWKIPEAQAAFRRLYRQWQIENTGNTFEAYAIELNRKTSAAFLGWQTKVDNMRQMDPGEEFDDRRARKLAELEKQEPPKPIWYNERTEPTRPNQ